MNRLQLKIHCNSCNIDYDLRLILQNGDTVDNIRLHQLFHYVPCCGNCGSNNFVMGVQNPYIITVPQAIMSTIDDTSDDGSDPMSNKDDREYQNADDVYRRA